MMQALSPQGFWARWVRRGYFLLGMGLLALALVGAFLPVMPSTIFVILAAACFGRASQRWENWLLSHPRFGPALLAWREQGAISRRGKCLAIAGISLGIALFWWGARPTWPWGLAVTAGMLGCAIWLGTRPEPQPRPADLSAITSTPGAGRESA